MKLLSIVIPVFNEAATLEELLRLVWNVSLPGNLKRQLLIVDNLSTDGSRRIAENFVQNLRARQGDVAVVLSCATPGKGNAVRCGLQSATGEIVLIQDADLEYDVSDYPALLQPILEGRTRLVLGSRHLSIGDWKIRKFSQRPVHALVLNLGAIFFHGLFNLLYGVRLSDPTTMYKVFARDALAGLTFTAGRFDFDYELLGKLLRSGLTPIEVPVNYRSRSFDEGKKIRVFIDPWTWVWAIVRYRFCRLDAGTKAKKDTGSRAAA